MTNTLYLCEKPSQARDIATVLGIQDRREGYICVNHIKVTWCLGHLLELAPPDAYCEQLKPWRMDVLPVIPTEWRLLPKKQTESQLKIIKKLLKETTTVVIATDADREGDVIGREVLDYCGYQGNVQRLWLRALDSTSIKKALASIQPGESTYALYQAGLGRQRADWSIGMNMTMAASCLFGTPGQGVLSVGRVQTPTLALVVNRDLAIEQFSSKAFYELTVLINSSNGQFYAKWQTPFDHTDEEGHCLERSIVETASNKIKDKMAHVSDFSDTPKKSVAPTCFSLSNLQKICSSQFGFSAKQTLEIAQSLYERHKATTYPRTDSGFLPEDQFREAKDVLSAMVGIDALLKPLLDQCDLSFKSPVWNDKKVTAHHGIIPTMNKNVSLEAMTNDENRVYDLIRRYYLAQFMSNFEYTQRKIDLICADETLSASCNMPTVLGWKQAMKPDVAVSDDKDPSESTIPLLNIDDVVTVNACEIRCKQTQPPARFTEGTLISAMKNIAKFVVDAHLKKTLRNTAGIGTEATRASIIEKLIHRGFLTRKKKQLISTERGRALISVLPDQIKNPGTTAIWEQALDDIASGQGELNHFLFDQVDILAFMLDDLAQIRKNRENGLDLKVKQYPCPKCQSPLARRKGKKGFFWGCTKYPNCNGIQQDKNGKPHQLV